MQVTLTDWSNVPADVQQSISNLQQACAAWKPVVTVEESSVPKPTDVKGGTERGVCMYADNPSLLVTQTVEYIGAMALVVGLIIGATGAWKLPLLPVFLLLRIAKHYWGTEEKRA